MLSTNGTGADSELSFLLTEVFAERLLRLDDPVPQPFIEDVGAGAQHIGAQPHRAAPLFLRPAFHLFHEHSSKAAAPVIFIDDETGDFGWHVRQQRVVDINVHPADQPSVAFSHVHGMTTLPNHLT